VSAARPIVFDLGGVVVDWQPEALIATIAHDEPTRTRVRREIFDHLDWLELDRGTLEAPEAIRRFATRAELEESHVAALLDRVAPSLTPRQDTLGLIRALRAAGHPLYFLSNMAATSIAYLEEKHDFWPLFDGGIISCRVGLLKPEAAMFERLLTQYDLEAEDTIFIDDLQANIDAAAALGMSAIRFTGAHECGRALRALPGVFF
jgi:putative hydrolase of the HAD superfamily